MNLRTTVGLFFFLLVATHASARDALPEKSLKHLKEATVYISAKATRGQQTGSGFLVAREGEFGFVVTNAHVVTAEDRISKFIRCVFNSGTSDEFGRTGSVVAFNPDADLAVLRVHHAKLPDPLEWQRKSSLRETMEVYAIGFPFGEALSTSRRYPAVTISRAAVSSMRRDDYGNLLLVQLDGGVNPGNSGGPVVDASGNLVGVSVAKVEGTEIAFAIPLRILSDVLHGEVMGLRFRRTASSNGRLDLDVAALLADPLHRLRVVQLSFIATDDLRREPKCEADGSWKVAAPGMRSFPMKIQGNVATCKLTLPIEGDERKKYLLQVRTVRSDRKEVYSAPSEFVFSKTGPLGGYPRRLPWEDLDIHPPPLAAPLVELPLPGEISDLAVAGGGRYLCARLAGQSKVVVFDVNQGKVAHTINIPIDGLLAGSLRRLLVVSPFDNKLYSWSLDDLESHPPVALPMSGAIQSVAVGHASVGPMLIRWGKGARDSDRTYLTLFDVQTMEPQPLESLKAHLENGESRTIRRNGLSEISPGGRTFSPRPRICAAGSGNVFSVVGPNTLEVLALRGNAADYFIKRASVDYAVPAMDGDEFCTSATIFSHDLRSSRGDQGALPTHEPPYLITFPSPSAGELPHRDLRVVDSILRKTVAELPELDEMAATAAGSSVEGLALEKRYHCIPQAELLVTVPPSNDRFVLRKLVVRPRRRAETSGPDSGSHDGAEEAGSEDQRVWRDKSGRFEVSATFQSFSNGIVKLKKEDGTVLDVPIDKLSEADAEYIRELARKARG